MAIPLWQEVKTGEPDLERDAAREADASGKADDLETTRHSSSMS